MKLEIDSDEFAGLENLFNTSTSSDKKPRGSWNLVCKVHDHTELPCNSPAVLSFWQHSKGRLPGSHSEISDNA
jgi:hypothetical protein